jgi:hypothetical protein
MHWILESGLTDFGYQWLIKVLDRYDIKYTLVKVVPQKDILLDPNFDTFAADPTNQDNVIINGDKIFPFGTMGLSRVSTERNWKPGSLFNDEFTFEKWSKGFGLKNLLNEQSIILKMSDELIFEHSQFFVRPCEDNKAFSGTVISKKQFLAWQKTILEIDDQGSKLNKDTRITVAPYQHIMNESRMFVFDGKVATGSYYKIGAKIQYQEVKFGDPAIEYTERVIKDYQPAKAFVIDIALTENGYKIIEINNINSVGLYHANVEKFVTAVMNTL